MPPADLPYTYCNRKVLRRKDGSARTVEYWRFRRDGHDSALPGTPGSPEFHARYAELVAQADRLAAGPVEPARHTFEWLARQYRASAEFQALAPRTRDDYDSTIDRLLVPVLGPERFDCVTRPVVKALRDAHRKQPRTAHKIKQMVSRIYSWADEESLLPAGFVNPAMGIKRLKAAVKPIEIWSDDEFALATGAPIDAMLYTAVLLAAYTGQRRTDLPLMDWSHYHGGTIRVRQNKTGEGLDIPCHPVLRAHLDRIRTGFGGPILRSANGKPVTPGALSQLLIRELGKIKEMPPRSWHGLRYLAAGRMEEAGCTVTQVSAVIGHRTYQMTHKYMAQRREAKAALAQMEAMA